MPEIKWRELNSAEAQAHQAFRPPVDSRPATFYEVLEVATHARPEVIRAAYRALMEKFHPDKNTEERRSWAEQMSRRLNEAYAVLSDPQKRRKYDYAHGITGRD